MPLAPDLTVEILNWLTPEKLKSFNENWKSQGGGYPDEIVNDLISVMQTKNQNYESILGYIETQAKRKRDLLQEYSALYSWLVDLVYQLLYFRQVNNNEFLDKNLEFYKGIEFLVSQDRPLRIFSLNHDSIIELIAAKYSIPIHHGFSASEVSLPRRNRDGVKIGSLRAEIITQDDLNNKAMYFPNPGTRGIYLMKIHGALDTFTFNDGNDLLRILPETLSIEGIVQSLRQANEELVYKMPGLPVEATRATNEIAYADESGEMQFLRRSLLAGAHKFMASNHQVLPKVMLNHFKSNLNFVTNLIFIGYSFGDWHINNIIKEWLSFTDKRSITIVDPCTNTIPQFLLHLASQVSLETTETTAYLDKLANIQRTRLEKLQKEITKISRRVGKEKSSQILKNFADLEIENFKKSFAERLKKMTDKDKLEDPAKLIGSWESQIQGSPESTLERMLNYFNESIEK